MSRTTITDEIRQELNHLRKKTGVSTSRLLRGHTDKPKGLNAGIVNSWLAGKSTTAEKSYLEFVLRIWRTVDPIISVTSDMTSQLNKEFERTEISAISLLKHMPNQNEMLDKYQISNLRKGKRKTISQNQWDHLLESLENLPTAKATDTKKAYLGRASSIELLQSLPMKKPYISGFAKNLRPITPQELIQIKEQIERTGISPSTLIRQKKRGQPESLHVTTVDQWLDGRTKRTSPERIKWVLHTYKKQPDKTE